MERDLLANNQFDKQATLNIYPNPFNSNIEISIDEKIKEAKLFTILGEEILVNLHPLNENLIHIERLESLKTGLYIIKITTLSGKTFSKKMTKK
ncbi:T9SS type A sorting domain-containing protein [Flavobacterium columnare]|nr:T9SS type A sorting domain-containing protein [Flavobacterium columnare]